jgi:hypothetical protein
MENWFNSQPGTSPRAAGTIDKPSMSIRYIEVVYWNWLLSETATFPFRKIGPPPVIFWNVRKRAEWDM